MNRTDMADDPLFAEVRRVAADRIGSRAAAHCMGEGTSSGVVMDLSRNDLTGRVPSEWLKNLRVDASGNRLAGFPGVDDETSLAWTRGRGCGRPVRRRVGGS